MNRLKATGFDYSVLSAASVMERVGAAPVWALNMVGLPMGFFCAAYAFWPLGAGLRTAVLVLPFSLLLLPFAVLGFALAIAGHLLSVICWLPFKYLRECSAEIGSDGMALCNWRRRCFRFLTWQEIVEVREIPTPPLWHCEVHLKEGEVVTFDAVREWKSFQEDLAGHGVRHTEKDYLTGDISDRIPRTMPAV